MPRPNIAVAGVGLLLTAAAQWWLRDLGRPVTLGLAFAAVGVTCFAIGAPPLRLAELPRRVANTDTPRWPLVILAFVLGVATVVGLASTTNPDHRYGLGIWIAAIVVYLAAFARPRLRGWNAPLLALTLGALGLRSWRLASIPWTLSGDEASQGLWARRVLSGELPNAFHTGWLDVPNLSFYWQALGMWLVSDDVFGSRFSWALVGAATVPLAWHLWRRCYDESTAWLAAAGLAVFHYHLHFSRLASNQIGDAFFATAALLATVVGIQDRRPSAWAAAGVISGVALYGYAGSRQVGPLCVMALLLAAWSDPARLRGQGRNLLTALVGYGIAAGPVLAFALERPDNFHARANAVGIFQSGWFEAEIARGATRFELLFGQIEQAFLAYHRHPDQNSWYALPTPLFDPVSATFSLLGLGLCLRRARRSWKDALVVGWLASVLLFGGAFTTSPPESQRLVSTSVPAVLLLVVGLRSVVASLPLAGPWPRLATAAALLLFTLHSLHLTYIEHPRSWRTGSFNAEIATRLGHWLADQPADWEGHFHGPPRMWAGFSSTPFLSGHFPLHDVLEAAAPPPFEGRAGTVWIFVPDRWQELARIRRAHPGGKVEMVRRIGYPNGPLLFVAYVLPSARPHAPS